MTFVYALAPNTSKVWEYMAEILGELSQLTDNVSVVGEIEEMLFERTTNKLSSGESLSLVEQ